MSYVWRRKPSTTVLCVRHCHRGKAYKFWIRCRFSPTLWVDGVLFLLRGTRCNASKSYFCCRGFSYVRSMALRTTVIKANIAPLCTALTSLTDTIPQYCSSAQAGHICSVIAKNYHKRMLLCMRVVMKCGSLLTTLYRKELSQSRLVYHVSTMDSVSIWLIAL